jgi:integrase
MTDEQSAPGSQVLVQELLNRTESAADVLAQAIPSERADQQHVAAALLALQQDALHAAAQAADEAARHATFESYREELSYHTCRRQRADLACFMRYLDEAGVPTSATCTRLETHLADDPRLWRHITFALVLGFRKWQLWEKGYAIESVNARLSTVKRYASLACQARSLDADELTRILQVKRMRPSGGARIDEKRRQADKPTRVGRKKAGPTFLAVEHLRRLFAERPQSAQGWRDLVLLRLLFDMSLRPNEAVALCVGDIDLAAGTLRVIRRKTTTEPQWLPLTAGTWRALGGYIPQLHDRSAAAPLLVRTRKDGDFEEEVQAAPDGPGWTTTSLYRRVRMLGERIGIADLCPYDARHSWARGVVKAGTDIVTATKFGGWKSHSKMLARYYGEQDVVEPVKLPWE